MLKAYRREGGGLRGEYLTADQGLPEAPVWIDMVAPTLEERRAVDAALGLELPTREDMEEIEVSSRLYAEDGGLFMTALVLSRSETEAPETGSITFVLVRDTLVTIRYIEPKPFSNFATRCERPAAQIGSAAGVLVGLLEAIIDRSADVLERVGGDVERLSAEVFAARAGRAVSAAQDFRDVLTRLGAKYHLTSKMRESLVSIARVLTFLSSATDTKGQKELRQHVKTMSRDVASLSDHATFVSNKLTFLLDATLGLINIEQNNVIKIMSVAAIVFLPPTLIASWYGMNFDHMPELDVWWAYPLALCAMVVSAILPYLIFKRRGWL